MAEQDKVKVLLVEDDAGVAELVRGRLRSAGLDVVSADCAEAAEALLRSSCPDLVLLDYSLPGKDGRQFLVDMREQARAKGCAVAPPVIITTGRGDERLAVEMMRLGAADYLVKDAEFLSRVGPAVERVLREHMTRRRLAESENRYRELVESLSDAVFVISTDGTFTYMSAAILAISGYCPEEVVGTPFSDWIHAEDLRAVQDDFSRAMTGSPVKSEFRFRKKDGSYGWGLTSSRPVTENGRVAGLRGVFSDITERRQMESRLRESAARFRAFFSGLPMGVAVYRPLPGSGDFEIVDFSPEAERIEGVKKENLLGRKVTECFPGVREMGLLKLLAETAADGRPRNLVSSYYSDTREKGWRENTVFRLPDGLVAAVYRDTTKEETARQELREKEGKYRALLESMPDIVMNFDREYRHIFVSSKVAEIGIEPDLFLGRTHAQMGFPQELCRHLEEKLRAVFEGRAPLDTEFEADLPAGRRVFSWRLTPQFAEDGSVESVTSLARDITVYRALETDYRQLFNTMLDGFALHEMIYDSSGNPADYRFLRINPAFEHLTGLKAAETEGRTVSEIFKEGAREWVEIYGKVVMSGEPVRFEKFNEQLGKHYDILAFRPRPGQFATIFTDVTEHKKTEMALRESAAMLQVAGRLSRFGGWSVDLAAGRCHWSDEVAAIHEEPPGFSPEVEKGISYYAPEYRDRIAKAFEACARQGIPYDEEMEIITARGARRWIRTIGEAERDGAGKITRVSGSFQDITDRKRMESELLKAQKIESLGVLAGGIAHDFNNLLTGITANLSLLAARDPAVSGLIEDAMSAARAAQGLTAQLLSFSTGGQPVKREICVEKTLRETFRFAVSGSSVRAELGVPEDLWSLNCDEGQLKQAVLNLLLNGVQAMPGGGTLSLKAENLEVAASPAGELPAGKYLRLEVSDTGVGIPEKYLDRIFEPYFTTKAKGHGLGLSMAWNVVRAHGGHIVADSKQGKGTRFTLWLPATGRCLTALPAEPAAPPRGSGRVLLLEDEEIVYKAAARMLQELGYTCEAVRDGTRAVEAYEKAQREGRPFSAVILDLTIPGGMGGREAGGMIRRAHPGARIIVSSGYSEDSLMADYEKNGFDAVLPKPYRYEDLAGVLARVLNKQVPGL